MLLNCGVGEESWESPTSPSVRKSVLNIHWKDWCWSWNSNTLATWCEELTHWKRPWCWERLKARGEGDDRGWDGWMASLTQWHEFEQAVGVADGQWGLACCNPWGCKEQLNLSCVATNLVTLALKSSSFLSHFPKLPQRLPLWSRSERVKFKNVVVRSTNWSIHLCLISIASPMQGGSLFR